MESVLAVEYDPFEVDYEEHLSSIKITEILLDWINEAPEDYIMEKYKVTPGELNYKTDIVDWLLYSLEEISMMKKNFFFMVALKLQICFHVVTIN